MMTTTRDSLVADYLRELGRAAQTLPRSQRDELMAEIRQHLDHGLAADATEADVRNLIDDLGSPAEIVAAACPDRAAPRRGAREVFGLLLLVTGLPPILGWVAGVGLVLWSPLWTARQKLLGILVWPGGLVAAVGVCLALAPVSKGISCDLTQDGRKIPGSCANVDAGLHPRWSCSSSALRSSRRSSSPPTSTGQRAAKPTAPEPLKHRRRRPRSTTDERPAHNSRPYRSAQLEQS